MIQCNTACGSGLTQIGIKKLITMGGSSYTLKVASSKRAHKKCCPNEKQLILNTYKPQVESVIIIINVHGFTPSNNNVMEFFWGARSTPVYNITSLEITSRGTHSHKTVRGGFS